MYPCAIFSRTFLSTSPLRGTTQKGGAEMPEKEISIHVPLAGDDRPVCWTRIFAGSISIHVPLAGDDTAIARRANNGRNFYPRPPCGGRPWIAHRRSGRTQFLSTSPLRGTTGTRTGVVPSAVIFLSTSPLRGTTFMSLLFIFYLLISIHVPLAGDDRIRQHICKR